MNTDITAANAIERQPITAPEKPEPNDGVATAQGTRDSELRPPPALANIPTLSLDTIVSDDTKAPKAMPKEDDKVAANDQPVPQDSPMPKGELVIDLADHNIQHVIGTNAKLSNGTLHFDGGGLVVEGEINGGTLAVDGMLIVQKGAKITADIACKGLINMGDIRCGQIEADGLIVAWAGVMTANTIGFRTIEISSSCKVKGQLVDICED